MKFSQAIKEQYDRLWNIRRPAEIEAAASALAENGSRKARDALLNKLAYPHTKDYIIWKHLCPLLTDEDAPKLLGIDDRYCVNSRTAAKYKLPMKAQVVILSYIRSSVCDAGPRALELAVGSRYREISNTTFELLLLNDTPAIREVLMGLLWLSRDQRKSERRARLSFEALLTRLEGRELESFLKRAYEHCNPSLKPRVGELLENLDHNRYIRLVRKQFYLEIPDILALEEDGNPASISRLIKEANETWLHRNPTNDYLQRLNILIGALTRINSEDSRAALINLLKKFRDDGCNPSIMCPNEFRHLTGALAALKSRKALPILRSFANDSWGIMFYASVVAILEIEEVTPGNKRNRYMKMARERLDAERRHLEERERRISSAEYRIR